VPFKKWAEYFNIQRAVELPAPVYDALKASAEKYAGIGCGGFGYGACPRCISGHALALDGYWEPRHPRAGRALDSFPTMVALAKAFDSDLSRNAAFKLYQENDRAVEAINERKGVHTSDRVTFEEFAEELNIVRVAVLAPNVYDALEASSAKFGGIGADAFDGESLRDGAKTWAAGALLRRWSRCVPRLRTGHRRLSPGGGTPTLLPCRRRSISTSSTAVYDVNDQAVFAINERKVQRWTRVSRSPSGRTNSTWCEVTHEARTDHSRALGRERQPNGALRSPLRRDRARHLRAGFRSRHAGAVPVRLGSARVVGPGRGHRRRRR
jgi:hypothetical protein